MNARAFRLVFSRALGMLVPAWEGARSQRKSGPAAHAMSGALVVALLGLTGVVSAQQPAGLIPHATLPWVGAYIARGLDPLTGLALTDATTLTIQQTQARAILDWQQFNLQRGETVVFDQEGNTSWAALNRIHDLSPSLIQGALRAPGTIYLINANGILFADGARIDTGGLVASTLRIQDQIFEKGVLSILNGDPAFFWEESATPFGKSFVRIEHGAEIKTTDGGRVMLFAPVVENAGRIATPGGQAILAAGAKVYLAASGDARLRGLLVEVDPLVHTNEQGNVVEQGGTVTNAKLGEKIGEILADRGNVTLVGYAVKQNGSISATTSVSANGSIYLLARDKTVANDIRDSLAKERKATRTGTLELGEGSRTVVLPSTSDRKGSIDSQSFNPSQVVLQGGKVHLKQNAGIIAPGGQVDVTALQNPNNPLLTTAGSPANASRIYVETGSFIDVSGTEGTQVSVARNFITAELRGNELRDSPLQRGGILEGKTVRVDIRKGTSVGDVSAYIAQVERGVGERTAVGGDISLQSEGDVVVRTGAALDVSGGVLEYTSDLVKATTKLVSGGQVYDIGDATADRVYQAVIEGGLQREGGYLEGKDAGSVRINARAVALDGTLLGSARAGTSQRADASVPKGGRLILGEPGGGGVVNADYRLPAIVLARGFGSLPESVLLDPLGGALGGRASSVRLSSQAFETGGFNRLELYSNESIVMPVALNLLPGGSVSLQARSIAVTANITVPGGSITMISGNTAGSGPFGLSIGDGVKVSTAGSWTNDLLARTSGGSFGSVWTDGGSIALSSVQQISIGTGASLDVSGSAWLQQSGKVRYGDAGSIEISTNVNTDPASDFALDLRGSLIGYSAGKGGALTMRVGRLQIGGTPDPGEFALAPEFFRQGGFSSYSLSAIGNVSIAAGAVVRPQVTSLLLDPAAANRASGSPLFEVFRPVVLPVDQRTPASLSLAARGITLGNFLMEEGASVVTDIGGSVSFSAGAQLTMLGTVVAPGGKIRLSITSNPGDSNDPGYVPEQTLWIGSDALLSTPGAVKQTVSATGLRTGTLLGGGEITITANRGAVVVQDGARFDLSGTTATFDLPQALGAREVIAARTLYGNGGNLSIEAQQAIFFDGAVRAAGGGPGAAGGSFEMILNGAPIIEGLPSPYPLVDRVLTVVESGSTVPPGLRPGDPLAAATVGQARIAASRLREAGFEEISLTSENRIRFDGAVNLFARRSVVLDAPIISGEPGAVATVRAAYVGIGNRVPAAQGAKSGSAGSASFTAEADVIDLDGAFGMQGFGRTVFDAETDIRLRGILSNETTASTLIGSLNSGGDVEFIAQQVYPTTLTQFTVTLPTNVGSVLRVTGRDGSPATPLSAGGLMAFTADRIVQDGVLRAPLGEIRLTATDRLEFSADSLTSVSADGLLIPFGKVENGKDWLYDLRNQVNRLVAMPPEKRIQLGAPDVDVAPGSKFDLSGGGDLFAYEFIPGLGGSVDYLAKPGTYAIVPDFQGAVAAFDRQYSTISDLKVGDRITLSGGNGLRSGTYTLLPGHYALLPGAYAVQRVEGFEDMTSSQRVERSDGSVVMAGARLVAGTGALDNRSSGFLVETNAQVLTRAQYNGFRASSFFDTAPGSDTVALPRLPIDAGQLIVAATSTLRFDGDVDFRARAGGRGGLFDVNAPRIAVVTSLASAPAGFLALSAERINSIGADSILIGGVRTTTASGTRVDVGAEEVLVDNAGAPLMAGEIVLAARQKVRLASDSAIATAQTAGAASESVPLLLTGDGALLRVAEQPGLRVQRVGATRAAGELTVGANVTLSGLAVELDSTLNTQVASSVVIDAASVGIAASRINFGTVPGVVQGLVVGPDLLGQLQSARALLFRSYSSVDFFGPVALGGLDPQGSPLLADLTIDAPALVGHGGAEDVVALTASNLTLSNSTGGTASVAQAGSAQLQLLAPRSGDGRVVLGRGAVAIEGFQQVSVDAARELLVRDQGTLEVKGDLTIVAGRIAGTTSSSHEINASGELILEQYLNPLAVAVEPGLDSRLTLTGATILHTGIIDLPTGTVVLRATQGNLVVGSSEPGVSSVTRVVGVAKRFDQVDRYSDAGAITLESMRGDVIVDGQVTLDVSAHAGGGNAGELSIHATNGTIRGPETGSSLLGNAGSGGLGGQFRVDAASIDNLTSMLSAAKSGGFTEQVAVRLRSGDLNLTQGVQARVIALSVDAGMLSISGATLDASGASGGDIRIFASGGATLGTGASLVARATGAGKNGGRIVVGTSSGALDLRPGSEIDVMGGVGGDGGEILLRAPRTATGGDVAITNLGSEIKGAREIAIEAVQVYSGVSTIIAGSDSGEYLGIDLVAFDSSSFMDNAAAILGRLGRGADPTVHVRPGVEIRSSGTLTLATEWDLFAQPLANGESGYLTLRAEGDLLLQGTLSDGFDSSATAALLQSGHSWSYRLVAGADMGAADVLTVQPLGAATSGDVVVSANTLVRTGTGRIDVAAQRDFRLTTNTSVLYTAGRQVAPLDGFEDPDGLFTSGFPSDGGDVTLRAGRDVVGVPTTQLVSNWLWRQGTTVTDANGNVEFFRNTAWSPRFDRFRDNIGALGGGDVTIDTGRDVRDLSVMLPTNARMSGTTPSIDNLLVQGGGDLSVRAGGDVAGGKYLVARGSGLIEAGGSLLQGRSAVASRPDLALYPLLFAADTDFEVKARDTLNLEAIINPTVITQIAVNGTGQGKSFAFTYDSGASLRLSALTGDVTTYSRADVIRRAAEAAPGNDRLVLSGVGEQAALQVTPPLLDIVAMTGDVTVRGRLAQFPASRGQLGVYAGSDIRIPGSLTMSDADPLLLAGPANPQRSPAFPATHAALLLHAGDTEPVRLVALTGDIVGGTQLSVSVPKPARIFAARDIVDLDVVGQNLMSSDVTQIIAGNDIRFSATRAPNTNQLIPNLSGIVVGGPGRLDVTAGRDIDLGSSKGIISRGNLDNAALADAGAALRIRAGNRASLDATEFLNTFPDLGGASGRDLGDRVRSITGKPLATDAEVRAEFLKLTAAEQLQVASEVADLAFYRSYLQSEGAPGGVGRYRDAWVPYAIALGVDPDVPTEASVRGFASAVVWPELRGSGREAASADLAGDYSRGFNVLARSRLGGAFDYSGDIKLIFSQVKTERGGSIELFAPGGGVNVGLATPPAGFNKGPDQLGILSVKGGDVSALVRTNFEVNQSRVFTLEGGSILVWSSEGNIDAGRGAKTAVSAPPPIIKINAVGELVVEFPGAASGSGIGVLLTREGIEPGDVDLIAPTGFVNAGDAGIRSSGNVTIAAVRVIGADNIRAGGTAVGVPASSPAPVTTGAVSNVGAEATKGAEKATQGAANSAAQQQRALPSFLTVEVIGLGDDDDERKRKR